MIERKQADALWRRVAGVGDMPFPDVGLEFRELPSGLIVPGPGPADDPEEAEIPTGVDLFAGCGGFSCGFHQAGFRVVGALEWWLVAAQTYLCNLGGPETLVYIGRAPCPEATKTEKGIHEKFGGRWVEAGELFPSAGTGWIAFEADHTEEQCGGFGKKFERDPNDPPKPFKDPKRRRWFHTTYCLPPPHRVPVERFWICDVREITPADMLAALGMEKGEIGCVFGGPPCQGFSFAGKRNVLDLRNSLVFEFCRYVLGLMPKTMVMENVEGIKTMVTPEGLNVVDAMCHMLEDGGFGTFDALRRSLAGMPSARGAMRQKAGEKKVQKPALRPKAKHQQKELALK